MSIGEDLSAVLDRQRGPSAPARAGIERLQGRDRCPALAFGMLRATRSASQLTPNGFDKSSKHGGPENKKSWRMHKCRSPRKPRPICLPINGTQMTQRPDSPLVSMIHEVV